MSMPPPPPQPQPSFSPPPGYQPYPGGVPPQSKNSGMAIAGMVLSLVGLIPCFWALQVPGLLGAIFSFIGVSQTKDGGRRGRGMAIAGAIIGVVLVLGCIAFWIWVASQDNCEFVNNEWVCYDY